MSVKNHHIPAATLVDTALENQKFSWLRRKRNPADSNELLSAWCLLKQVHFLSPLPILNFVARIGSIKCVSIVPNCASLIICCTPLNAEVLQGERDWRLDSPPSLRILSPNWANQLWFNCTCCQLYPLIPREKRKWGLRILWLTKIQGASSKDSAPIQILS